MRLCCRATKWHSLQFRGSVFASVAPTDVTTGRWLTCFGHIDRRLHGRPGIRFAKTSAGRSGKAPRKGASPRGRMLVRRASDEASVRPPRFGRPRFVVAKDDEKARTTGNHVDPQDPRPRHGLLGFGARLEPDVLHADRSGLFHDRLRDLRRRDDRILRRHFATQWSGATARNGWEWFCTGNGTYGETASSRSVSEWCWARSRMWRRKLPNARRCRRALRIAATPAAETFTPPGGGGGWLTCNALPRAYIYTANRQGKPFTFPK